MIKNKTVCFDFDGVIHSYTSGWKGMAIIEDPPVEGIECFMGVIKNLGYEILINSTRCATTLGYEAVKRYLNMYNIPYDKICKDKPPANIYIDDRAIKFSPSRYIEILEEIKEFRTWQGRE